MQRIVDNLVTFRIINMLVQPFNETDAFKLGIIDEDGNNLIPSKKLTTSEQKDSYTLLHRYVFNTKKLINKLPGGESKLKNVVSAYFLVKESYEDDKPITEESLFEIHNRYKNIINVEELLLAEEVAANNVGGGNIAGTNGSPDAAQILGKKKAKSVLKRYKRAPKKIATT